MSGYRREYCRGCHWYWQLPEHLTISTGEKKERIGICTHHQQMTVAAAVCIDWQKTRRISNGHR